MRWIIVFVHRDRWRSWRHDIPFRKWVRNWLVKPIRVVNFRSQNWHEYEGVRSSVEEALALTFRFARISVALLIWWSSNTASMLLRLVERLDTRHSQLADLTVYLVIVVLHCVAKITPSYTVTTTLMNVVVSCIVLMKRQLFTRYGRENLVAFFNTSCL